MNIFNINYSENYNESKPDLLFCDLSRRLNDNNLFLTRFLLNTADLLSEDFNIFWIVETKTGKSIKNIKQNYKNINFIFSDIGKFNFYKHTTENYIEKNKQIVIDCIKSELKELKNVKGLFFKPAILLSGPNGDNEFYDVINKENITEKLNEQIFKLNNQIEKKTTYAYSAYMTKFTRVLIDIFEYFNKTNNAQVYQFIIDPASYSMYFENKFNAKTYYFENDTRGTRNFKEFPIGQLNYFYNYTVKSVDFLNKENNFIWGGLALFQKGNRMEDFKTFLKDFRYDKSCLHISKTNSIKNSKNPKYSKILLSHPLFEETCKYVINHPLNLDLLDNISFEKKLNDFKYTLILKCISKNDSLNFRIFYSLLFNVLPFIADNYDPENIQIPEKFYKQLRVKNNKDIEQKITYFNNNPAETNNLINDLKSYYMDNKFFDKNYYLDRFKNNYFTEIY